MQITMGINLPPNFAALLRFLATLCLMDVDLDIPGLMPIRCMFPINWFSELVSKTAMPFLFVSSLYFTGWLARRASKFCATKPSERDQALHRQPLSKTIASFCSSTAFR